MFRGDHPELSRALGSGLAVARELGHPRAGSEHLLLGLSLTAGRVSAVLARHGATAAAVRTAARAAGPLGAGVAADRELLAPLGIDPARILSGVTPAVLDRVTSREPILPLGAARARRRCARLSPPLGLDAQAAYAASLRLALARMERQHRAEHLALCLVTLDPGVSWLLRITHTDPSVLLADLASTFPPPDCGMLRRADRRIALRPRCTNLVGRYQRSTGRTVSNARMLPSLIQP
jgi:Clp amino terminal domain, pathogenicity island component